MSRLTLVFVLALALTPAARAAVVPYASSQTIFPSGPLPAATAKSIRLNAARGETEHAQIVVTGAATVSARIESQSLEPLPVRLLWAHYVQVGTRRVPDALLPWMGAQRAAEEHNQPLWVEVSVPPETRPGIYAATIVVDANGRSTSVPLRLRVFDVSIPPFRARTGNLNASFFVSAQSYVNKVDELYGLPTDDDAVEANETFFRFLADHRISPASYGFGEPNSPRGYLSSTRWWLNSAGRMAGQVAAAGGAFPAMRVPISSQRASPANYAGGLSPYRPETWCGYLRSVHSFWRSHGWTAATTPYVFAFDEPGATHQGLLARQAAAAHRCFPGVLSALTMNPTPANRSLWDSRGGDDIDIWVPLARRWYGTFTGGRGRGNERRHFRLISAARSRGKTIWSYTYTGVPGSPGFAATEPLSNSRMFLLWNALERSRGVFYTDGVTSYNGGDPMRSLAQDGQHVLAYPGAGAPVASARLEQIRDGIEDWSLFELVRRRHGAGRVRGILGARGLFSADAARVRLACNVGCELHGTTKYAWPRWSHDLTTPRRIEGAKLDALRLVVP